MGCDIHSFAETKTENGYQTLKGFEPFGVRTYGTFGFLANVRNYSAVPPIAERRGIPEDASPEVKAAYDSWGCDAHSASWLSIDELATFDYEQLMEDRRVARKAGARLWDAGYTCDEGEGQQITYRHFLGQGFFADLEKLKNENAARIVFWFDN